MPRVHLSWPLLTPDPNLRVWRIYANPDREVDVKGRLLAEVPASEFETTVEVDEGYWAFRVVGVTRVEAETPWETTAAKIEGDFYARGPGDVPPTPENANAGAVGDGFVQAVIDAPPVTARGHRIQLIGGPPSGISDPALGHFLGEYVAPPKDLQGADGASFPSPFFPLTGQGRTDVRKLWVRPISGEGTPGVAVERSIVAPERGQVDRVVIASIDRAAGTYSGFPAPGSTDGWEASAGYGFRARALPTWGAWTSDFGTWGSGGLLDSALGLGRYVDNLKIRTNEIDLGSSMLFQLDAYHEAHRRDASLPAWGEAGFTPAWPVEEASLRLTSDSDGWMARELTWGGMPRQPLREVFFEYVASDSTPVDTSESSWRRYVPGLWIKARYIRVRLRLVREPLPWFRFATGSVQVAVLRPRTWLSGSGSPEGAVAAPFGTTYVRTDVSPYALFLKTTTTGNTGWIEVARTSDLSAYLQAGDDLDLLSSGAAASGDVPIADGLGGIAWGPAPGGGSGDFMADGSVPATGDFDMDAHKLTDVGDGAARTDGAAYGQIPFNRIETKNANYSVLATDRGVLFRCDTAAGNVTITLPTAPDEGFVVAVVKIAATNTLTVNAGGADVLAGPRGIAGASTTVLYTEAMAWAYDATAGVWVAIAHVSPPDGSGSIATLRSIGTSASQACSGADGRLTNQRTPTDGSVTFAKLSGEVSAAILFGI